MTEAQKKRIDRLKYRVYEMQDLGHPAASTLAMIKRELDDDALFNELKVALGIKKAVESK